jgi:dehydrogenase/reductase SDR family protein 1
MGLVHRKIALVTGASRGVGRGVAYVLGAEGATVIVTARTMTADQAPRLDPVRAPLPGTLAETVERVQSTGAEALALPADLGDDEQVRRLIEEIIRRYGRLDILVNSAMGFTQIDGTFWEAPLDVWDVLNDIGPRSAYVASYFAVPHMIRQGEGFIINISSPGAKRDIYGVAYRVAKAATDRLTQALAHDLRPHNIPVVSLWPRLTRTERVELAARGDKAAGFALSPGRDVTRDTDSPELSGRAIAYLAADQDVMRHTGKALTLAELAQEYGFSDLDGTIPVLSDQQRAAREIV